MVMLLGTCNDLRLLMVDEPTSGLEPTFQVQILDLLQDMRLSHGLALLLITHDLALVASRADWVSVMYHGRLIEAGTTKEVFDRPVHPYTRAVIDAQPDFKRTKERDPLTPIPGSPPRPGQEL